MAGLEIILGAAKRRDRLLALFIIGAIITLSWLYLMRMNAVMFHAHGGMEDMMMPGVADQLVTAAIMWSIMMVAMMLPTALPAVAMFDQLSRRRAPNGWPAAATGLFIEGYLAVWIGYSVVAAAGQVALSRAALLTPMLQGTSQALGVAILLLQRRAGVGPEAWQLLRRLLLGADGGGLCDRHNEPALDGCPDFPDTGGEGRSGALAGQRGNRCGAAGVGGGSGGAACPLTQLGHQPNGTLRQTRISSRQITTWKD